MNLNAVLSKTAKGAEEIATRKYKLAQRLRTLLIVVNGKAPVSELVAKFESIGDVTPMLEQLVADGFIAEARAAAPAAPAGGDFPAARAQLARAMLDALGPDGDSITEKLEACQSAQELKNYIDTKRAMLESALGRRGEKFWKLSKDLLG
jgi:hypothetical protein